MIGQPGPVHAPPDVPCSRTHQPVHEQPVSHRSVPRREGGRRGQGEGRRARLQEEGLEKEVGPSKVDPARVKTLIRVTARVASIQTLATFNQRAFLFGRFDS